jgi:hypothetical protein
MGSNRSVQDDSGYGREMAQAVLTLVLPVGKAAAGYVSRPIKHPYVLGLILRHS